MLAWKKKKKKAQKDVSANMDHGRDCTERDVSEGQISPKLLRG